VNRGNLSRVSTPIQCFWAFFPLEAVTTLAGYVNERVSSTRTAEQLQEHRRFKAVDDAEILLWIAQRLQISLDVKITIELAYKKVQSSFLLFGPIFTLESRIRWIGPGGFRNLAFIFSMAT